jgi:hypothetical protein
MTPDVALGGTTADATAEPLETDVPAPAKAAKQRKTEPPDKNKCRQLAMDLMAWWTDYYRHHRQPPVSIEELQSVTSKLLGRGNQKAHPQQEES